VEGERPPDGCQGGDRVSGLLAVIGTRPQFIKYAALADALEGAFPTVLVDTGQHYDPDLSSLFFEELRIRRPDRVLDARQEGVAAQLAHMISGLDAIIQESRPAALVCMGDTNSTLAAALAGLKRALPIAHIEAGERNFRRGGERIPPWSMPEETNRIMVDQASSLLLCASRRGLENLRTEGRGDEAVFTGDLMRDLHQRVVARIAEPSEIVSKLALRPREFVYCTVHRAVNTDDHSRLQEIVAALECLKVPVVFPVHPRTRRRLEEAGLWERLRDTPGLRLLEPMAYGDSLALSHQAHCVITDSGGVTREAFFSGVPSALMDESTAWIDLVTSGWAVLTGADRQAILAAVDRPTPSERPDVFGDGQAAWRIVDALSRWLGA
jgi:UDP-GlcNAc3NAcA epimerase